MSPCSGPPSEPRASTRITGQPGLTPGSEVDLVEMSRDEVLVALLISANPVSGPRRESARTHEISFALPKVRLEPRSRLRAPKPTPRHLASRFRRELLLLCAQRGCSLWLWRRLQERRDGRGPLPVVPSSFRFQPAPDEHRIRFLDNPARATS
jgi:hypothetical protein